VVPVHANIWPIIAADPAAFHRRIGCLASGRTLVTGVEAEVDLKSGAGQGWIPIRTGCGGRLFLLIFSR
jgi:hypothetical protein